MLYQCYIVEVCFCDLYTRVVEIAAKHICAVVSMCFVLKFQANAQASVLPGGRYFIDLRQNLRMVLVGRDLKNHLVLPSLLWPGTPFTRIGNADLHPTWP